MLVSWNTVVFQLSIGHVDKTIAYTSDTLSPALLNKHASKTWLSLRVRPPPPFWQCQDFERYCYSYPSLMVQKKEDETFRSVEKLHNYRPRVTFDLASNSLYLKTRFLHWKVQYHLFLPLLFSDNTSFSEHLESDMLQHNTKPPFCFFTQPFDTLS